MYGITTEFNRSSEDIPWYLDSNPELKVQFSQFIEDNVNLINYLNVDNLGTKQITVVVYANEETFNLFMSVFNETFPTFFADRDAYCEANNISITRTTNIL
jgi:hypothetical protein